MPPPKPVAAALLMGGLAASACGGLTALDRLDLPADGGVRRDTGAPSDARLRGGEDAGVTGSDGPDESVDADVLDDAGASGTTDADPSYAATTPMGACNEGQNTDHRPSDEYTTSPVAWEYIPAHDMDVTRLELVVSGGAVALYDSDGDHPGAKLFEGSFSTGAWQWRGVDVSPPVHVVAHHAYYIEQVAPPDGDRASATAAGTAQRQFNPPGFAGSAGWEGPFIWIDWTARIIGSCP